MNIYGYFIRIIVAALVGILLGFALETCMDATNWYIVPTDKEPILVTFTASNMAIAALQDENSPIVHIDIFPEAMIITGSDGATIIPSSSYLYHNIMRAREMEVIR